jgi:hypothetical protein
MHSQAGLHRSLFRELVLVGLGLGGVCPAPVHTRLRVVWRGDHHGEAAASLILRDVALGDVLLEEREEHLQKRARDAVAVHA